MNQSKFVQKFFESYPDAVCLCFKYSPSKEKKFSDFVWTSDKLFTKDTVKQIVAQFYQNHLHELNFGFKELAPTPTQEEIDVTVKDSGMCWLFKPE